MQVAHEFQPRKILVPTDFSASAEIALHTAVSLAKTTGSELYLLHIIPMLPIVSDPEYPGAFFPEHEYLTEARAAATQKLTAIVDDLKRGGTPCHFGLEIGNDVVGNILMVADREHVDLIIISTHGISGWRPMIFGSIAEKVIRLVECPLLLLRSVKSPPPA